MSIIFLIVLVLFIGSLIVCFNRIVAKYNRVQRAWSDVLVYERQKTKILDALTKETNGFKQYEQELLAKITSLRSAIHSLPQEPDGAL